MNEKQHKHTHTHTHNNGNMKTADKTSISITRVKSSKIDLKETESNKARTRVICKKIVWIGLIFYGHTKYSESNLGTVATGVKKKQ